MWQFWFERAGCHIIHLELVPEDAPTLASALAVASELGWTAAIEPTCRSPWRTLPSIQEGWDNGLKSKFKANLRNREQRLAKVGDVRFEVARGPEHLARAMELFYQLEASGWKGQKQTSIRQRPQVRRFYDAVVAGAPEDFWMPILSVDDKPIAAQFIRVCGATVYLLKIGFDPEFSPYSPGQLITARVMDYSIAHGCKTFDFLGEEMTWKMDWNPKLRTLCRAIFFAPALAGRCAYWSRVGFRELLKKVPGLHAFVRRTRKHSATE
jgi:CelD/BcsL family acetyltransferase involved in cellulose biosynthesis